MKLNHRQKVKLAKQMATTMDKDGHVHTPSTGIFLTEAWQKRKDAIAKRISAPKIKSVTEQQYGLAGK